MESRGIESGPAEESKPGQSLGKVLGEGNSDPRSAPLPSLASEVRSAEESVLLDDLMEFIVRSGSTGKDELFSFRREGSTRVKLRSKEVREALKDVCEENDLDPDYFSSHSLRKGTITEMRSLGASEDNRRDRGNYAPNSQVMNVTYDYGAGIGPLASNSLVGGHK